MHTLAEILVFGLASGSVYALVGLGFSLVLGLLNVANFAHGAFAMLAMYGLVIAEQLAFGNPFSWLPVIVVALFIIGFIVYRVTVQPVLEAPETTHVAATIGLLIIIENVVSIIYGPNNRTINTQLTTASVRIAGSYVSTPELIGAGISIVIIVGFYIFLTRTTLGLSIRACASNIQGARISGINIKRTYGIVFALSIAIVAIAGAITAAYQPFTPLSGDDLLTIAFAVTVLAGAGNVRGALVSGWIIGLIGTTAQTYSSAGISNSIIFGVIIVMLLIRPQGVFTTS